jgi:hypothetical protein
MGIEGRFSGGKIRSLHDARYGFLTKGSPILGGIFLEFFPAQKSRKYIISHRNFSRSKAEVSFLLPHRIKVRRSTSRWVRSEEDSQYPPVATKVRVKI